MPHEYNEQYEAPGRDVPWPHINDFPKDFSRSNEPEPSVSASSDSTKSFLPTLKLELADADDIYESARAIRKATCKDSFIDTGTYENKIFSVLGSLSEQQRVDLRQVYQLEFGTSLEQELKSEMSGRDLEKARNLLFKKDGTTDDAGFVKELVTELNHTFQGRSRGAIAEALRQKLVSMKSGDIDAMNQDYKQRYGIKATDDLLKQGRLSDSNKEVLKVLFKGSNKIDDADMAKIAKIAIDKGDLEMFGEAMSHTSESGRKEFAEKIGDVEKLRRAFSSTPSAVADAAINMLAGPASQLIDSNSKDQALIHALDYMKYGKLSARTQILESSGWIDDNEKAIETAVNTMSGPERVLYAAGSVFVKYNDKPTKNEQEAIDYYNGLQNAFSRVGNKKEIARWDKLAKLTGDSHEKKTISDLLSENRGVLYNNRSEIVDGLLNLSDEEIEKYRNNESFQSKMDKSLSDALGRGSVYSKSANHILNEIKQGRPAKDDIIVKLFRHGSNWDADDAEVVRTVEKEFKENGELHRKLLNPQTIDELAVGDEFRAALKSALGADYRTYGEKLITNGRLSVKDHTDLCQGYLYDDVASMAKSVVAAEGKDRELLLSDDKLDRRAQELQEHVFSNFWEDQSHYLKTALKSEAPKPEDKMRSFVVGGGATGKDVLDILAGMDAKQQTKLNFEYAKKYHSCMIVDLLDHLSTDESGMLPTVVKAEGSTLGSMYNEYLNRYTTSKDGLGEWFVNEHWDVTGFQAQEAVNAYAEAVRQSYGADFPERERWHREMAGNIADTLHNFRKSKRAAGEAVGNAAIVATAVAATPFTSGLSLSLVTKVALFGAAGTTMKMSTGAAFNGADYTSDQMAVDGGSGFVSGAMMAVGPRELAQLAKIGGNLGNSAADVSIDGLAMLSEKAGESIVKEGSNELIKKRFVDLVQQAILNNSDEVPAAALKSLAARVATKGNEQVVQMSFELAMQKATQEATANLLAVKATQYGLPTITGGASGTLSGGINGASQWDSRDPFGKNIERIGVSAVESGVPSAIVAFGTSAGMDLVLRGPIPHRTQNDQTRGKIIDGFLGEEPAKSEFDSMYKVWNKDAISNSIKENQLRFRQARWDGDLNAAAKQPMVDPKPVVSLTLKESGRYHTPEGPVYFNVGDELINRDYNAKHAKPGTIYDTVPKDSWKRDYKVYTIWPTYLLDPTALR